jgi:uncharacterized repeat protein (TIGR01451 family)
MSNAKRNVKAGLGLGLATLLFAALLLALAAPERDVLAQSSGGLVISQVYGGGGNVGSIYTHDFIELFNAGTATVDVSGWSVQYASATGTTWAVTTLSGSIPPGGYYLIQQAAGAGGTAPLPTPDAIGTIAMAASNAKVALVNSATPLTGACPAGANIIDFVGYGTANCYEGSGATPALSNSTAALRKNGGCTDTDNNALDFVIITPPTPRNSSVTCYMCVDLRKAVAPITDVPYLGTVTYTIHLAHSGGAADTNVLLTDTLPAEVDFGAWIEQPLGAAVVDDQITWSGALGGGTAITFTFSAVHVGDYGDIVTNTAVFSGTVQAGSAQAVFTVEVLITDVTFVYHDIEGVVETGETVWLAGGWNSWTPVLMGDAGGGVYTSTVPNLTIGDEHEYKYIVNDGATDHWEWLNSLNRSYTVVDAPERHDYRAVEVGWANLQWPYSLETNAGEATEPVYGQVYVNNLTNPVGQGRAILAQVGYGDMAADPAGWDWFPMAYSLDAGNNDEFTGVMTPTVGGVYSYTTRFDCNWGVGNPNAGWYYAVERGVLTSQIYDIAVTKTALVDEVYVYDGAGALVTYTIQIENVSTTYAADVITLTDVLPPGFMYVLDDSGVPLVGTGTPADPLTWVWDAPLAAGGAMSFKLTLLATDGIDESGVLVNMAAIEADPPDWVADNNMDAASVMVHRVIPIGAARFRWGESVTIEGIVTVEPGVFTYSGSPRYLYIQDDTGGILVYRPSTGLDPVGRHHRVRVTGAISEYRDETQILPAQNADVVDLGLGIPVTPARVDTVAATGEDVEGQLLQVAGYVIGKPNAYTLYVDDGSGMVEVYRYYNLGTPGDPNYTDLTPYVLGDYVVASGVARGYNYSGVVHRELLPRGPADITEQYPVTFVYHDLENVVPDGVTLQVAGDLNGWSTTATPMTGDGVTGVYTATVILDVTAPYTLSYKIVAGDNWDDGRGDILNSGDRQAVISAPATLYLYRDVHAGYAVLNGPAVIAITLGETTPDISGEAWFSNIPFGTGQVLRGQIGYGTGADPAGWTWVEAAFNARLGNNDVFAATLTPTAPGVYSYTIRFDGNWAAGNPNSTWHLGDLDGVYPGNGFDIHNVGVLTVTQPDLTVSKDVAPSADLDLGQVVTYTITLSNDGDGAANGIVLTDTLPVGITFVGFVTANGATHDAGVISWSGNLAAGADLVIVFTATLDDDSALYGETITNRVEFASANAGTGSATATFTVKQLYTIYAPVVFLNWRAP